MIFLLIFVFFKLCILNTSVNSPGGACKMKIMLMVMQMMVKMQMITLLKMMMMEMQNLSAKMTLILETVCLMCQAKGQAGEATLGHMFLVLHLHT